MSDVSKRATKSLAQVYQFKITLLDIKPPIWRRVQVPDGTLNDLHEHIQTAMGWTNSHLHQFEIGTERYGDPELLTDDWDDQNDFEDSTAILLSELCPADRKSFKFYYEYDFGDGWRHEIILEGVQPVEAGVQYPCCAAGARACPPEDIGGPGGYVDFAKVIQNPRDKRYREMQEWVGESFDPEVFDSAEATQAMQEGLLDWDDEL